MNEYWTLKDRSDLNLINVTNLEMYKEWELTNYLFLPLPFLITLRLNKNEVRRVNF